MQRIESWKLAFLFGALAHCWQNWANFWPTGQLANWTADWVKISLSLERKEKSRRIATYQLTKVSKYAFVCRMLLSPFKLEADNFEALLLLPRLLQLLLLKLLSLSLSLSLAVGVLLFVRTFSWLLFLFVSYALHKCCCQWICSASWGQGVGSSILSKKFLALIVAFASDGNANS